MRRAVSIAVLASLALAGLASGVMAASGGASSRVAARVTVTASEFKFTLSRRSVPAGTVVFTVVNRGKLSHDFRIAGKTTPVLRPGASATLRVTFAKRGRYGYLCTLPGHAKAGMKGILAVATTPALTTSGPPVTAATTVAGPTTTVTVDMYEYRYELSQTSLPSGKVVFVITNRGGVVHNFDLVGVKAGAYLSPGATETWTVGLAAGAYSFKCDVPFHAERGMTGTLSVG